MHINNVNSAEPTSYNFVDNTSKTKKHINWDEFFNNWKEGKYNFDELTAEEKDYIMQHDTYYAQFFI